MDKPIEAVEDFLDALPQCHQAFSGYEQEGNVLMLRALDETLRYIEAKYVDTVDVANLKKDAISQLLAQLDPHSVYISPEELARVEEDMTGNFEGVGIEFLLLEDTIRVVTPLSGGPAETAPAPVDESRRAGCGVFTTGA